MGSDDDSYFPYTPARVTECRSILPGFGDRHELGLSDAGKTSSAGGEYGARQLGQHRDLCPLHRTAIGPGQREIIHRLSGDDWIPLKLNSEGTNLLPDHGSVSRSCSGKLKHER